MTKFCLLLIAIPAMIILLHTVCVINAMSHKTSEVVRWANIIIGLGAGIEIIALIASHSIQSATWESLKILFAGATMMNCGYAVLYFVGCKKCDCNNGFRDLLSLYHDKVE